MRLEKKELPRYLMAKTFFDCREFDRCAAVFLPGQTPHSTPSQNVLSPTKLQFTPKGSQQAPTSKVKSLKPPPVTLPKNLSQKALFLALYARYLSGEKRKNEDSETILGPADGPITANKEVSGILATLEDYFNTHAVGCRTWATRKDGWITSTDSFYLKSKSETLAKQWLLRSVNLNPYNWSGLARAGFNNRLKRGDDADQRASAAQRGRFSVSHSLQSGALSARHLRCTIILAQMESIFPSSAFLAQQKALLHYHARRP